MKIIATFTAVIVMAFWARVRCVDNRPLRSVKDASIYGKMEFKAITDETVYNKWVPPLVNDTPIQVTVNLVLYSFGFMHETEAEYSIQLLLRLGWTDPRLVYEPVNDTSDVVFRIDGNQWHVSRIWTPSVLMANNKQPKAVENNGKEAILSRIYSNGTVLISKRVLFVGFCYMDFTLYPLDVQTCDIQVESYELSTDKMALDWIDAEPLHLSDISWSGFQLTNYWLSRSTSLYSHTGVFSKLVVTFQLQREFGHFLIVVYIPCIMFVITSWLSFWLEIPAAPARVTLCVTSLLTLVTSAKSAREELPEISYIHALDVWLLICIVFVFASLIEYAIVNFIYHSEKRRRKRTPEAKDGKPVRAVRSVSVYSDSSDMFLVESRRSTIDNRLVNGSLIRDITDAGIELSVPAFRPSVSNQSIVTLPAEEKAENKCNPQDLANSIDHKCRLFFPISFLFLNVIYWTTLALLSHLSGEKAM